MSDPNTLLSVGDAAFLLGMTNPGVRQLERRGHLTAQRTAGGWRLYRLGDVLALALARNRRSSRYRRIPPHQQAAS